MFRTKASSLLRLLPSGDDDDVEIGLEKVAHQIACDLKESLVDDKNYSARVDMTLVRLQPTLSNMATPQEQPTVLNPLL